ncbi:unnamed protein product [Orchesella dallaii]|uniref:Uncharacterized protein n=1 Tax=Orchesella dallaii TaxID=48710 RepID=A0ABP1R1F9_9HEXA
MNRWEIVLSGALVLSLLLFCTFIIPRGECSNIRQRSDGCGPHPLIALAAASRPFGSNGVGSLNDVLRAVRSDPVVWPVMQNLLRRYDDCIRAADGLHYKRSDDSAGSGASATYPVKGSDKTFELDGITTGTDVIPWLSSSI